ncbi:hypothetical protein ACEY16_07400 [Lactiplantibacillus plantarum]
MQHTTLHRLVGIALLGAISKVDSKVWYKEDRAYLPSVASKSAPR